MMIEKKETVIWIRFMNKGFIHPPTDFSFTF